MGQLWWVLFLLMLVFGFAGQVGWAVLFASVWLVWWLCRYGMTGRV